MKTIICISLECLGCIGFFLLYMYTKHPMYLFVSGVGFAFAIALIYDQISMDDR
jgi:hypothetical protein